MDLLLQKMKASEKQQSSKSDKTVDKINAIFSSQMDQTDASLSTLNTKLAQTNQNLQNLPGKWSAGSYCILASGSCPTGFTKQSGHIRAISTYAANTNYIGQQRFGDSKLACHGTFKIMILIIFIFMPFFAPMWLAEYGILVVFT